MLISIISRAITTSKTNVHGIEVCSNSGDDDKNSNDNNEDEPPPSSKGSSRTGEEYNEK
ncbi:MAG: hypothetical protein ACJ71F_20700 [Nitrososphaeraceae archaeon]